MRCERKVASQRPVARWERLSQLAPELSKDCRLLLELFPTVLDRVWPLNVKHRRELPNDIRDLSAALTCQRAELKGNYWHKPGWISAYLYYFLPWNLVRLCRLLPAWPLGQPESHNDCLPLLLDAGSGPLTFPLALWISRPDLRDRPLHVFALDSARQPLELGKALFEGLGEITDKKPWALKYATGPLESLAALAPRQTKAAKVLYPWLASAANVLNEIRPGKHGNDSAARLEDLLDAWAPLWQEGGRLLFIEPGTRLGGSLIMHMREAGIELGLQPIYPCTHSNGCPLFKSERPGLSSSWCHFVFSAQDAPQWLKELSQKAGLFKTFLTLAPLLLAKDSRAPVYPEGALPCRVISQVFPVQNMAARYGCSPRGLCLLYDSRDIYSGSLCLADVPAKAARDRKSGALIVEPWQGAHNGEHDKMS